MKAPRITKHAAARLEDLRYAIHGLCAPFACGGTWVPDEPLTLCFKDKTRLPVVRAPNPFEQAQVLQPLVERCTPAPFGQGRKTRYNRNVRDALQLKAEGDAFTVLNFDPAAAGILDQVRRELLPQDPAPLTAELYNLNIYASDGHFAPHKDTPRGSDMIGTLVVCLPSQFSNGALVVKHQGVFQTFDWSKAIQQQTEPTRLHWAAFFGDVDHQIERVWSGLRVTLTYLLRRGAGSEDLPVVAPDALPTLVHDKLHLLLADRRFLPKGATLLDRHAALGDPIDVAQALWTQYEAEKARAPRAWALPIGWLGPETIERLCSTTRVEPEDVDTFLENPLSGAPLSAGDKLVLLVEGDVRAVGMLTSVEPGEYTWEQTLVHFPSNLLVNPTSEIKELSAAEWRDIRSRLPKTDGVEVQAPTPEVPEQEDTEPEPPAPPCNPQNIILYGPPGTGKTYGTVRRALELILGPEKIEGLSESGLTALFREHQARGQIEFVTFHQAYGYEEFVEGLRPVLDVADSQEVRYELHDGVFKRIALRAAAEGLVTPTDTPDFDELWSRLVAEIAEEDVRVAQSQSGKHYVLQLTSQNNIMTVQCEVDSEGNVTDISDRRQVASKPNSRLIWTHRSTLGPEPDQFTYARFTDLFARERGGQGGNHYTALWIVYSQLLALSRSVAGRRQELINRVARVQQGLDRPTPGGASFAFSTRNRQYVLIIDEINRGNVSKILGELITLLEPDKRLGTRNELKLPLSYSPTHRFAVPPNLHVLGTMNTADRSIALMDVALRRRFTFEELMPDSAIIREVLRRKVPDKAFIDFVVELFDTLNARIRFLYDRDHQIGHAYFLDVNDVEDLRRVFVERVIPLLQEYFYGAWDKICTVLGCPYDEAGVPRRSGHVVTQREGRTVYTAPIVRANPFPEVHTLGFDHDEYEDRVDYTVRRGFQEGRLSRDDLIRTFVGVLQVDQETYASRLAALTDHGGDTNGASEDTEDETAAGHVETEEVAR